jgi:hypothetical protein
MAETIGSLGGVPLGRAGTGAAVMLGEKDYSYLKPKEVKEKKYNPLVSDADVERLLKEAGTVWRPDQKEAKQKFDVIYTKIKEIELNNKAGEKEKANILLDELRNNILVDFENFVKNSKTQETNGLQYENDRERQALLYDDEDDMNYQAWLAKPVANRELNPPIQRANDLNYVPYAINNMSKLMVADKETDVRDSGGFRNTKTNTYYTEDKVRDASRKAAYNMSGKYMNFWKQKMLAKAVDDDPSTPEDERELAAQIVSNLGPGGQSPELYDFIANQNYMLFSGRMERIEKKKAPAPAPKVARGGGGRKRTATATVTTGQENTVLTDINTGVSKPVGGVKPKVAITSGSAVKLPFVVDAAYVEGYLKENPWAARLFRSESGAGRPDQFVVTGTPQSVYYDPETQSEYLAINTKVGDNERVVMIPYAKPENEVQIENIFADTEEGIDRGITFREYFEEVKKKPLGTPGTKTAPVQKRPGSKPTTPAPAGGAPKPAGGAGGTRKRFNPATGKIE